MLNTIEENEVTIKKMGLIVGIALFLMTMLAIAAEFNIFQKFIHLEDAAATMEGVRENISRLRVGGALIFLVILLDIIVAWGLYFVLAPVNKELSLLTAWLRVVYAAIFAAALFHLFSAIYLLEHASDLSGDATHLQSSVMSAFFTFRSGWNLGLAMFGLHLVLAGVLIVKSKYIPAWLGVLVGLAGMGYIVDGLGKTISASYTLEAAMFTFPGELILMVWLIIKGFSKEGAAQ